MCCLADTVCHTYSVKLSGMPAQRFSTITLAHPTVQSLTHHTHQNTPIACRVLSPAITQQFVVAPRASAKSFADAVGVEGRWENAPIRRHGLYGREAVHVGVVPARPLPVSTHSRQYIRIALERSCRGHVSFLGSSGMYRHESSAERA